MRPRLHLLAAAAAATLFWTGCAGDRGEQAAEKDQQRPATAAGVVRISDEAEATIALKVERVSRKSITNTLPTTGWLTLKPGAEATVKAPSAGFILPPSGQDRLELGAAVKGGQHVLGSLLPLLSPVEQADLVSAKKEADILIRQSLVTLQRAEAQLEQLKPSQGAVAGTRIAELQETADRARIAYEEAQQKLPFLPQETDKIPAVMPPTPIAAPIDGRIVKVHVSPRQWVAQADPLWTIADWSALWVRVAVFEGDLARIAQAEAASVRVPGTEEVRAGSPVRAPQATEPGRRTVDLFYEVENAGWSWRPGQAVSVLLPLGKPADRLLVPQAAVIWDGMGNSWVYVREPEQFRRRRVELGQIVGKQVVVERGLDDDDTVVAVGAQALYGEEFKGETQAAGEPD